MSVATINSFVAAMQAPSDWLMGLTKIQAERNSANEVAVRRTKHFAECFVALESRRYLLSMPLSPQAELMAQWSHIKLRQLLSPHILSYTLLPLELSHISGGALQFTNLLLHEVPYGSTLDEAIEQLDSDSVFAAIDTLQGEMERLGIIHHNLRMENLLLDGEGLLHPIHCHYVDSFDEQLSEKYFAALRADVASAMAIDAPQRRHTAELQEEHSPRQTTVAGYQSVGNPFEGMRTVCRNNLFGYIDSQWHEVIEPQFVWAGDFQEGCAEVQTPSGMGLINKSGEFIIEPRYRIVRFDPSRAQSLVCRDSLWATFDYNGVQVSEFRPRWW